MTTLSTIIKRPLAIASGAAAVAFVAISLPGTAQAAMSAREFMASLDELKQICNRIDEPVWIKKRSYGCGERVTCYGRRCYYKRPVLTHVPNEPEVAKLFIRKDGADHGNGGNRGRGRQDNSPGLK